MNYFSFRDGIIYLNNVGLSTRSLYKHMEINPQEFVNEANNLFSQHKIAIPRNFVKSIPPKMVSYYKIPSWHNFENEILLCVKACLSLEQEFDFDTKKILKSELKQNVSHACSLAMITYYYLKRGHNVKLYPKQNNPVKKKIKNPDLEINGISCDIKTLALEKGDAIYNIETGRHAKKILGKDILYDIGTSISNRLFKGILQAEVVFIDLTARLSWGGSNNLFKLINSLNANKLNTPLPNINEMEKNRVIFFTRDFNKFRELIGFYIDFQPELWNLIKNADYEVSYFGIAYLETMHNYFGISTNEEQIYQKFQILKSEFENITKYMDKKRFSRKRLIHLWQPFIKESKEMQKLSEFLK